MFATPLRGWRRSMSSTSDATKASGKKSMDISKIFPQPHPQTAGRVFDREAILILADSSEVNVLNAVGSRVFELSDGQHSIAAIIATIVDEFDVAHERAKADVIDFLQQLADEHVMVLVAREGE
jgi:hypothetical protein